ncbi:MAG TPA: epoxyqueuosine reductase QueH, partial [Bacteroidales bacterium]|nr:epoxyqueuosine reductase QueH [Bacteroidales bacterium]
MENKLPRLLLHVCCGPCSTTVLERLVPHYAVSVFFFNPNIAPNAEYDKRKNEAERYIQQTYGSKIPFVAGNADPALFLEAVRGYENEPEGGRRCEICFRLRLQETARYAKENNFDFFCTT